MLYLYIQTFPTNDQEQVQLCNRKGNNQWANTRWLILK